VGGFLPEALQSLAVQHDQNDTTRRRMAIWVWFFHTNVLAALLFIPLGFFMRDVFPSFNVKVGIASAVRALLTVVLPLLVSYLAGLALFSRLRNSPGWAYLWHRLLLKLPITGKIHRLRANAVFARTLQQLYHAGLPPVTAWETATGAVPNLFLAERFMAGRAVIESTARPSAALEAVRLMEPADLGLVATGESAGEIPQALDYLANRYEEETRVALGASVARGATSFLLWSLMVGAIGFGIVMYFYGQGALKIGEME
jgi:type II secretory pathway component PulF